MKFLTSPKKYSKVCPKCKSYLPNFIKNETEKIELCGSLFHDDLLNRLENMYNEENSSNNR